MRAAISILALGLLIALMGQAWGQTSGTSALEGVVTLVDTNRGLLVIQDREQGNCS